MKTPARWKIVCGSLEKDHKPLKKICPARRANLWQSGKVAPLRLARKKMNIVKSPKYLTYIDHYGMIDSG
jgi:hypothetical protein